MESGFNGLESRSVKQKTENVTFRIYSHDQTEIDDYIEFYHDQTNGVIGVGNGVLKTPSINIDGSVSKKVTTVTSTTHTAASEAIILVDDDTAGSTVTVTLPAAAGVTNRIYHIKKLGTTASIVVDGNASETIDGATTQTISSQYDSMQIVCDGTGWYII